MKQIRKREGNQHKMWFVPDYLVYRLNSQSILNYCLYQSLKIRLNHPYHV